MSALPPKADIAESDRHFRFVPKADIGRLTKHVRLCDAPRAKNAFRPVSLRAAPKGRSDARRKKQGGEGNRGAEAIGSIPCHILSTERRTPTIDLPAE